MAVTVIVISLIGTIFIIFLYLILNAIYIIMLGFVNIILSIYNYAVIQINQQLNGTIFVCIKINTNIINKSVALILNIHLFLIFFH